MNTMSTRTSPSSRRARRAGALASLFAVAVVLAGCSASESASADTRVNAAVAEEGGDAAFDNAAPEDAGSVTADRSVIITGFLYMTVEDPIAMADKAAGIVKTAGGRIDARSETAPDERNGGSAALTMRIPSNKLDAVVDDLRVLGTVDQYSTDSYDVTTEVTDLDAEISTLRASTARIEGLLADAKSISDIITLENELDGRQAELVSLEARQRGLDDQVSMSTINVSLTTEPVVIVKVDDSPKNFWDGLVSGWNGLVGFVSVALIVIGVLLPWLALMGLIAYGIVGLVRRSNARRARKAAAAWAAGPFAQAPAPAAQAAPVAQPEVPAQAAVATGQEPSAPHENKA